MSYKLIKSIWINKDSLISDSYNDEVLIEKDGFEFLGQPKLIENGIVQIIEGKGNTYAVLLQNDIWSTKNNFNVVVFEDIDCNFNSYVDRFENEVWGVEENLDNLKDYYEELKTSFKDFTVNNSSTPAAPNTGSFRASVSGKIEVREKFTSYGGKYGFNKFIPIGLLVGSGINTETRTLIQALGMAATVFSTSKISNARSLISDGTNFKTVGVAVD